MTPRPHCYLSLLLALASCGSTPNDTWRLRTPLHGVGVEVFDRNAEGQPVSCGLRRLLDPNAAQWDYEELVAPAWEELFVVRGRTVFGRKHGAAPGSGPLWRIPVHLEEGELRLGEPEPTPYTSIESNGISYGSHGLDAAHYERMSRPTPALFGLRDGRHVELPASDEYKRFVGRGYTTQSVVICSLDLLDEEGLPIVTLHGVRYPPRSYGEVLRVDFDHPSGLPVTVFLDARGRALSPELLLVTEFDTFAKPVLALPTSPERTRYFPITAHGTVEVEEIPCAGYYPDVALRDDPELAQRQTFLSGWTKEYRLPSGSAFGWVSADLTQETGPQWRSLRWWHHGFEANLPYDGVVIGQLLDGSWMAYDIDHQQVPPHQPIFDSACASEEEARQRYRPVYYARREKREAQRRIEHREQMRAWKAYLEELGMDSVAGLTPEEVQALPSQLYAIRTALAMRRYDEFDTLRLTLPGDYYLRYLLQAYHLRRVALDPATARERGARAVDPQLRESFERLASAIEAEEQRAAAQRAQERAAAEEARAAAQRYQGPPSWTPSYGSSAGSLSASDRAYVESSRAHEQYMQQMWSYLGGQSAWRPYR
ncbi:MAG: hypothetical protein JNM84_02775 [Planctomycetes bacterium]|nr:hypothetical protein [Planctomycetota bacterium]